MESSEQAGNQQHHNIMKAETLATTAFDTIQRNLFWIYAALLCGEFSASWALKVGAAIDQYKIKAPNERTERVLMIGTSSLEMQVQIMNLRDNSYDPSQQLLWSPAQKAATK